MAFARLIRNGRHVADFIARPGVARVLAVLCPLLFAAVLLVNAWIAEDAYITYRVIDNALHGYGLRWNVDERVQVYTHPLWMLLNLAAMALTQEEFFTGGFLAVAVALAFYLIVQRAYRAQPLVMVGIVFLPLVFARELIEFMVSGLENPLSSLLLAVFFLLFVRSNVPRWFWLSLTASCLLLTRFDLFWFILPPALYLLCMQWRAVRWGQVVTGTLPLVGWSAFSFLYYGFVFPNTKYAKLHTGIGFTDTVWQGVRYFMDFIQNDAASAYLLGLCLLSILHACVTRRLQAWRDRSFVMASGLVLYLLYLLAIGGDYMSGRFFTVTVTMSVLLLAEHACRVGAPARRVWVLFCAMGVLVLALIGHYTQMVWVIGDDGIADERRFYTHSNGLLMNLPDKQALLAHHWVQTARVRRDALPEGFNGIVPEAQTRGNAGMNPYFAGPSFIYIDPFGLTDAVLARLPLVDVRSWRVGHFARILPVGYRHFRETGDSGQMDPDLAMYVHALHEITSAPVFDAHRLRTLLAFHLGEYDTYRYRYIAQVMQRTDWPLSRIAQPRVMERLLDEVVDYADARNMYLAVGKDYRFTATQPVHARTLSTGAMAGCQFRFTFENAGVPLGTVRTARENQKLRDSSVFYLDEYHEIPLPDAVRRQGFDTVVVRYDGTPRLPGPSCGGLAPLLFYLDFKK